MYEYQGFWYLSVDGVEGVMLAQQNFKPRREDILLVTLPKAGATWFEPLLFFCHDPIQTCGYHGL